MYGSMNPPIHVSGHRSVEELRLVLNLWCGRNISCRCMARYQQLSKGSWRVGGVRACRASMLGDGRRSGDRFEEREEGPGRA
jgi:hypothetical protein